MVLPLGYFIQEAIREGGYTARNITEIPSVAVHLVGKVKSTAALDARKISLKSGLMEDIERFLESAGVPIKGGLRVLKADAASDAVVLTARGLEGTGREVVIKLANQKGIFTKHLNLKEPLMADAVQEAFTSALRDNETVLVRIEPLMRPVDEAIAHLPEAERMKVNEGLHALVRSKGLVDGDVKANAFAIPRDAAPVQSAEDLLSRSDLKAIDIGAITVPANSRYQPQFYAAGEAPAHINDLFVTPSVIVPPSPQGAWVKEVSKGGSAATGIKKPERAESILQKVERRLDAPSTRDTLR